MNLNNLTIDQLDALQLTTLDQLLLESNSGIAVTSSHRLFRNRLFAGRLFAPALWRGTGAEAAVSYAEPAFTITRQNIGTLSIARLHVGTKSIARQNVGTLEVEGG